MVLVVRLIYGWQPGRSTYQEYETKSKHMSDITKIQVGILSTVDLLVTLSLLFIYSLFCDAIKVGIKVGVCVFGGHESYLPVQGWNELMGFWEQNPL